MPLPHDLIELYALIYAIAYRIYFHIMGLFSVPLLGMANNALPPTEAAYEPGDKFPGMVNLSGTLCYMNSVLQAFASLPLLLQHLQHIVELAVQVDLPTPVTDALAETLNQLNTGHARTPAALRPHVLLTALAPLPAIRRLLAGREQQDAHELFVVLAEAVSDEAGKVAKEVIRTSGGLGQALDLKLGPVDDSLPSPSRSRLASPSPAPSVVSYSQSPQRRQVAHLSLPWEGLLARRRVCTRCGWSDVVRMDTTGGMELPVPRNGSATLDTCISEYLSPEKLSDVTCDMCTTRATAAKYAAQAANGNKQAIKVAAMLQSRLDAGVPCSDVDSKSSLFDWDIVRTDCLRETVVTRAPKTLRFHFVRSEYTPYGHVLKKTARIQFPLMFDLGAHMARGVFESRSGGVKGALRNGGVGGSPPRALYRLESAILHYGYTHSSGHFVAIRRKPGAPLGIPGKGWLQISDADVEEVGSDALVDAAGAVFMLFYERVELVRSVRKEIEKAEVNAEAEDREEEKEGQTVEAKAQQEQQEPHSNEAQKSNGFIGAPETLIESLSLGDGTSFTSGVSSFASLGTLPAKEPSA